MSRSHEPEIRRVLTENPDGLTTAQIAELLGAHPDTINNALPKLFGIYKDRWTVTRGQDAAVWVQVEVPADCPKPTKEHLK